MPEDLRRDRQVERDDLRNGDGHDPMHAHPISYGRFMMDIGRSATRLLTRPGRRIASCVSRSWSSTGSTSWTRCCRIEVFRNAAGASDWDVALVGVDGAGEVVASHGMRLQVDAGLGRPDAIVIPGGGWNDRAAEGGPAAGAGRLPARAGYASSRPAAAGWRRCAPARWCSPPPASPPGARPRPTTSRIEELRASGADLDDARVVDDGDLDHLRRRHVRPGHGAVDGRARAGRRPRRRPSAGRWRPPAARPYSGRWSVAPDG